MTDFFINQIWLVVLILVALLFVNGWTDAPNAVATTVASKALSLRRAVWLAAGFNFLGLLIISRFNMTVAEGITESIPQGEHTLTLLCSAVIAVVVFAAAAALFGIPTSESHALVAALSGASVGAAGFSGFSVGLWLSVGFGILFTSGAGVLLGILFYKLLSPKSIKRRTIRRLQIAAAALLSLIHGAQDGQKFSAVMIMSLSWAGVTVSKNTTTLFCALILGLGTALGGKKIIKKVGSGIAAVDGYGGASCDAAAFLALLICTALGMPVSTTHTKTSAVLGVGLCGKGVKFKAYIEIFSFWLLTFPVCFAGGYFITRLCLS